MPMLEHPTEFIGSWLPYLNSRDKTGASTETYVAADERETSAVVRCLFLWTKIWDPQESAISDSTLGVYNDDPAIFSL